MEDVASTVNVFPFVTLCVWGLFARMDVETLSDLCVRSVCLDSMSVEFQVSCIGHSLVPVFLSEGIMRIVKGFLCEEDGIALTLLLISVCFFLAMCGSFIKALIVEVFSVVSWCVGCILCFVGSRCAATSVRRWRPVHSGLGWSYFSACFTLSVSSGVYISLYSLSLSCYTLIDQGSCQFGVSSLLVGTVCTVGVNVV